MTNSEFLKEKTKKLHDSTEEKMGAGRIFSNDYSHEEYKTLLSKMYKPYSTVEKALKGFQDLEFQSIMKDTYEFKTAFLEKDFSSLSILPPRDIESFVIDNENQALGALYVLKGSDMGASIIMKRLERLSSDWPVKSFEFYASESNPKETWAKFKEYLDRKEVSEQEQEQMLIGAEKAFMAFH